MRVPKPLSLPCFLLASLQFPEATNSWSLSARDTVSIGHIWESTAFSRRRHVNTPSLTLSIAAKGSEAKASRESKKKSKKEEGRKSFDIIRNHRHYDRFEAFLESEIGLTNQTHVQRIAERAPTLLDNTEARLRERFNLLRGFFGYTNEDLGKMIRRNPVLFALSVQNLEASIVDVSRHLFEGDMAGVGVILKKQPTVLAFDVENTLMPKVNYLREEVFQGDSEAFQELILKNPVVLGLSLNSRIIPRAEALRGQGFNISTCIPTWCLVSNRRFEKWFKKKTGVPLPDDWCPSRKERQDQLSFEQRAQKCLQLLSTELALDAEEARSLMERIPGIKQRGMDNLTKKLHYLIVLFGSKEKSRDVILKLPIMLTVSLEKSLKPRVTYLRQTVFRGNDHDLIATVKAYPALITTRSLEKRLKPRIEATIATGLDPSDLNVGLMMLLTDKEFPKWLKKKRQSFLSD